MERNFETVMIEQCSPVLAGLKAANLFRHECRDRQALYATVASWNAQLNGRGIRLLVLKECPIRHWFLIYLYRPARLEAVLGRPEVRQFCRSMLDYMETDAFNPSTRLGADELSGLLRTKSESGPLKDLNNISYQ